eukprot:SAG11_NODE_7749_length_1101_cov_1.328343_2_plen_83_part_00
MVVAVCSVQCRFGSPFFSLQRLRYPIEQIDKLAVNILDVGWKSQATRKDPAREQLLHTQVVQLASLPLAAAAWSREFSICDV